MSAALYSFAFAGNTTLQYSEGGTDYDSNVKLDPFDRKKIDDISSITFCQFEKGYY